MEETTCYCLVVDSDSVEGGEDFRPTVARAFSEFAMSWTMCPANVPPPVAPAPALVSIVAIANGRVDILVDRAELRDMMSSSQALRLICDGLQAMQQQPQGSTSAASAAESANLALELCLGICQQHEDASSKVFYVTGGGSPQGAPGALLGVRSAVLKRLCEACVQHLQRHAVAAAPAHCLVAGAFF